MTIATTEGHGSSLALANDQDWWNDHQLAALRQMGLDKAGNGDLAVFMHVSQRTGLDPFAKQIYMIGRWSKDGTKYTIQTGIDGFRLIARRASDRLGETLEYEDTQWCGRDGQWLDVWTNPTTPPMAAKVAVLRHGKRFPAVANYSEYVQTVKGGDPNSMWARMPANQLAKCAEALALRKAFPQDLSGIYADEEMGQADRPAQEERPSGLGAALGATTVVEQIHDDQPAEPEPITSGQLKKIGAAMRDLHITERADALLYVNDTIGREVASRNELTKDEAGLVIDSLERDLAGAQS
jgi:phage recombination protein Bet